MLSGMRQGRRDLARVSCTSQRRASTGGSLRRRPATCRCSPSSASSSGGTAKSKWVKALEQKGVSLPVWPIGLRELPGWIANRMRQAGLQPERDAVALIADRVEGNLLAASQEIEKLRLLLGEGKVTVADVTNAVARS